MLAATGEITLDCVMKEFTMWVCQPWGKLQLGGRLVEDD
jgi:hypothetical protein